MNGEWNLPSSAATSFLQHYREKNGRDPLKLIMKDLRVAWGIDLYKTQVVTCSLTVKLERL